MKKILIGIYWQIGKQLICKKQVLKIIGSIYKLYDNDKRFLNIVDYKNVEISLIDSTLGHESVWEKFYANRYKESDFATHPRGRIMYDLKNSSHIIYADKCITASNILKLLKVFKIRNNAYRIEHDFHYMCDKCVASFERECGISIFDK